MNKLCQDNQNQSWKRMSFKKNKVWAMTDPKGNLLVENKKVLIKYNLKQDYEYRVNINSLNPEDQAVPAKKKGIDTKSKKVLADRSAGKIPLTDIPDKCIKIYTDGASSGNPGPSGIGIFFVFGENKKKISRYIGLATNNIAELTAIKTALEELRRVDLPVRIFSDSNYAIGVLTKSWKSYKNKALINDIKNLINKFDDIDFIKVKGHSGIKENELADFLATSAIKKDLA